jgi:hypothetical protein
MVNQTYVYGLQDIVLGNVAKDGTFPPTIGAFVLVLRSRGVSVAQVFPFGGRTGSRAGSKAVVLVANRCVGVPAYPVPPCSCPWVMWSVWLSPEPDNMAKQAARDGALASW